MSDASQKAWYDKAVALLFSDETQRLVAELKALEASAPTPEAARTVSQVLTVITLTSKTTRVRAAKVVTELMTQEDAAPRLF